MAKHHPSLNNTIFNRTSGLYTETLPRGGEFGVWKKRGGQKLTIVLCEAQGGGGGGVLVTLHLLCWHASITLALCSV